MRLSKNFLLALSLLFLSQNLFADDIIMSAPPRESKAEAIALYKPLADAFSDVLGKPVKFVFPGNFLRYQREMRKGSYDIIFDGPHFASWRIKHLGHEVLVKLTGTIEYFLLIRKGNNRVSKTDDLIGKKICVVAPPNLSSLTLLNLYNNPVRQPRLLAVRGGMKTVVRRFNNGACEAAIVRTGYYKKKLTIEEHERTRIIYKTNPLPNQVITVSKKLTSNEVAILASAIEFGKIKNFITPIAHRFGGKKAYFLAAKTSEYISYTNLLEGVIFGW